VLFAIRNIIGGSPPLPINKIMLGHMANLRLISPHDFRIYGSMGPFFLMLGS
jgi:hypothetical protein